MIGTITHFFIWRFLFVYIVYHTNVWKIRNSCIILVQMFEWFCLWHSYHDNCVTLVMITVVTLVMITVTLLLSLFVWHLLCSVFVMLLCILINKWNNQKWTILFSLILARTNNYKIDATQELISIGKWRHFQISEEGW